MKAFVITISKENKFNSQRIILKTNIDTQDVKNFTIMQILKPVSIPDALLDNIRTGTVWNMDDLLKRIVLLEAYGNFTVQSVILEDNNNTISCTLPKAHKVNIDASGNGVLKINGISVVGLNWMGYVIEDDTINYEISHDNDILISGTVISLEPQTLDVAIDVSAVKTKDISIESTCGSVIYIDGVDTASERWNGRVNDNTFIKFEVRGHSNREKYFQGIIKATEDLLLSALTIRVSQS